MITFDAHHAKQFLTVQFHRASGYINICSTGNWAGRCFPATTEGIHAAVLYAEWLDNSEPSGIYYRVTTLKEELPAGKRGGADDTLHIPVFWADLDYGSEGHKPRKDGKVNPPDRQSAESLISTAGLPTPSILVHSGGGLYPLWMPNTLVTPELAAIISVNIQTALGVASDKNGWVYGEGVGDLARVLRLPGSVNRKTSNWRACRVLTCDLVDLSLDSLPTEVPVKPVKPAPVNTAPRTTASGGTGTGQRGVFDALAETASWADILEPEGWEYVGTDSAGELWMRPGGSDSEYSARAFEHNLVCHSESAGLPAGRGQRLTKGRVYAWLNHGGDLSSAARALIQGDHQLPAVVRAAIDAISTTTISTITPAPAQHNGATAEELSSWVASFTAYHKPHRLAKRIQWLLADSPHRLGYHAHCLVADSIAGHYPANRAVQALKDGYAHHGGTTPGAVAQLLSVALGAILDMKQAA